MTANAYLPGVLFSCTARVEIVVRLGFLLFLWRRSHRVEVPRGCSPALEPARPGQRYPLLQRHLADSSLCAHACACPHPSYTHKHHTIPLDSWSISTDITIHQRQTKPTGLPAHSQGCTHNPVWLSVHSQTHWHNPTGLPVRSQRRTYKLMELPVG